jgi:chromosome segregation ATPase
MRSTALAFKDEYDEVSVSSADESSVAAVRDDIKELRSDLRTMAAKAASDLKEMWDRVDRQLAYFREDMREMRAETKHLREKLDSNYETLNKKIDGNHAALDKKIDDSHAALDKKIDANHVALDRKIDATNQEVAQLTKSVIRTESKLDALRWIWLGVGGLAGVFLIMETLNKFFHWY